jgi:hypothetical protein
MGFKVVAAANESRCVTLTTPNHAADVILTSFWGGWSLVFAFLFYLNQVESTF